MLRATLSLRNYYLRASKGASPVTQIRSGDRWWSDPERMYKQKLLYFTLGVDQLPLRRTAIIANERRRVRAVSKAPFSGSNDPTGYRRARHRQVRQWYRRIQYQEFYLQHLFTRYAWGRTRHYPSGGGKISGITPSGVWGFDNKSFDRYSREPLPAHPREIYEPRK
eukprot:PhM_4_TR1554/c0_g1_i1/m.94059